MIITILRKKPEGTVAENTLKHGCGGLNVDAIRVAFENEKINFEARQRQQADPKDKGWGGHVAQVGSDIQMYKEKGRWPANFILMHKKDCELKGTKKIKEGKTNLDRGGSPREVGIYKDGLKKRAKDQHQGEEAVEDWSCEEGCPIRELDRQSGNRKSGKDVNPTTSKVSGFFGSTDNYYSSKSNYGDEGGASRFFKQFKIGSKND